VKKFIKVRALLLGLVLATSATAQITMSGGGTISGSAGQSTQGGQAATVYASPTGNDANGCTFTSPCLTPQRVSAVLQTKPAGQKVAMFRGGLYPATSWTLGTSDSGTQASPVLYLAYPGESPVISGGRKIRGAWAQGTETCGGQCQEWDITLDANPSDPGYFVKFESLFYNGVRRYRPMVGVESDGWSVQSGMKCVATASAGCPIQGNCASGQYQCHDRYLRDAGDNAISSFHAVTGSCTTPGNCSGMHEVEILGMENWTGALMRLTPSANDGMNACTTNASTYCLTGITGAAPNFGPKTNHHYLRVNAVEDFNQAGQFYLDVCPATNCPGGQQENAFVLRYLAQAGENPNTDEVIVPQAAKILSATNVQYVTFSGLTFAHDNYVAPAAGQTGISFASNIAAAMSFQNSSNVWFDRSTWNHIGGWAIEFKGTAAAGQGNEITNFMCTDAGVGCIRLGVPPTGGDSDANVAQYNVVSNGVLAGGMRTVPMGPGNAVSVGNAHHNLASNLLIDDWYNAPTEIGESMGYDTTSLAHDNLFTKNVISNFGQGVTSDMGGIHIASGAATGNIFSYNVVHDATQDTDPPGYNGECIYVDNSSSYVSILGNLTYRCSEASLLLNSNTDEAGRGNIVSGNILAGGAQGAIKQTTSNSYLDLTATNNILMMNNGNVHGGPQYAHDTTTPGVQWYCQGVSCPNIFSLDYNTYFNAAMDLSSSSQTPWYTTNASGTATWMNWSSWQGLTEDTHSSIGDPGFVGPSFAQGDNYAFSGPAPAGFNAWDYSQAGPQGLTTPAAVPAAFPLSVWPSIGGVSPSTGTSGMPVTITGARFQRGATVTVGGVAATNVTWVGPSQLSAVVPAGSGTVNITVSNPNGKQDTLTSAFTYSSNTGADNRYCQKGDLSTIAGLKDGPANLLQQCVYTATDGTPSPGPVVTATSCSDFTSKLAAVTAGETLVVPATITGCQGNWVLPAVSGADANHWVTIRTDQVGNPGFPPEGTRATPCQIGVSAVAGRPSYSCANPTRLMPQLQCGTTNCQVLSLATGAAYYRLIGLEITNAPNIKVNNYLAALAGNHVILDRMVIHGQDNPTFAATGEVKGGVNVNAATYAAVIDSYLYYFMCVKGGACVDSQAVAGGNGSAAAGPIKIVNNYLEASGESYIFGGGSATTTPTDIEIRRNSSFKPLSWFMATGGSGNPYPTIKNLGELKNAIRVLLEGNYYQNNWTGFQGDQFGLAVIMTPKNQSSYTTGVVNTASPNLLTATSGSFASNVTRVRVGASNTWYTVTSWVDSTHVQVTPDPGNNTGLTASRICVPGLAPAATIQDVTFRYNFIAHAAGGIGTSTAMSDCLDQSLGIHRESIHDVIMDDINGPAYSNATSPCCNGGYGVKVSNDHPDPSTWPDNIAINHITALGVGFNGGHLAGLGFLSGNTVAFQDYFANFTYTNSIGPAPYGVFYDGSANYTAVTTGFNQLGCPNHDGTNCTWNFAKNLHVTGVWSGESDNTGYPTGACGAGGETCSPAGFAGLFVNFNSGNGGDYHLAAGSPYKNAGTDGRDLGADVDAISQYTNQVQ